MTYAEKQARAEAKRRILLDFLASGEVFSTVEIAALLLQCSRRAAQSTVGGLERDGALKSEEIENAGRKSKIYGITPHGLALIDKWDMPFHELGRTSPAFLAHKLDGQRMRIKAEAAGWTAFVPERLQKMQESPRERTAAKGKGKDSEKIPDFIATSPKGDRVAIEIERTIKTPRRYESVLLAHLKSIKAGRYAFVAYVCPDGLEKLVERAFARVETIRFEGENVKVTDSHRARFAFFSYSKFAQKKGA